MRIYQDGADKWKIGKNGEPIHNSYLEAKQAYLKQKREEIFNQLRKLAVRRNK